MAPVVTDGTGLVRVVAARLVTLGQWKESQVWKTVLSQCQQNWVSLVAIMPDSLHFGTGQGMTKSSLGDGRENGKAQSKQSKQHQIGWCLEISRNILETIWPRVTQVGWASVDNAASLN